MFHPDNIKNYSEGGKVSISVHKYFKELGGAAGLARALRTNLKVKHSSNSNFFRLVLMVLTKMSN